MPDPDDGPDDDYPDADPADFKLPDAAVFIPELDEEEAQTLDHETFLVVDRRQRVMELYRAKWSMMKIARELGCSNATVCRDIKKVLDGYRRQMGQDVRWHLANELQRLVYREAEVERDLERSRGEFVETASSRKKKGRQAEEDGDEATVTKTRTKYGDPRLHAILQQYWVHRCKLLGLLKDADLRTAAPPVKLVAGVNPEDVV